MAAALLAFMMHLTWTLATLDDVPTLAALNRQLIADEGSRNRMTLPELEVRMHAWLVNEYNAVLFHIERAAVAYALYRPEGTGISLRQFFVVPEQRRQGIGRQAISLLRTRIWPQDCRITVEALVQNERALAFWRAVGFVEYAVTLELPGFGSGA